MWTWIISIVALLIIDAIVVIWWKTRRGHVVKTFDVLNFVKLKRHTELNIFGVVFIGLLLNIMMLPVAIFYWLHLACTWHPARRNG